MPITVQDADGSTSYPSAALITDTLTTDSSGQFSLDFSEFGWTQFFGAFITPVASDSSILNAMDVSVFSADPTGTIAGVVYHATTHLPVGSGVTVHVTLLMA